MFLAMMVAGNCGLAGKGHVSKLNVICSSSRGQQTADKGSQNKMQEHTRQQLLVLDTCACQAA